MEVQVPKEARGIYVAPISYVEGERELLLPAGSQFKILEVKSDGTVIVQLLKGG